MKIVKVYIEHPLMQLNTTFDYFYSGEKDINKGIRVTVPFRSQKVIGFVDEVIDNIDVKEYEQKIGYRIKEIIGIIDEYPLINEELSSLAKWLSKMTVTPLISCLNAMLPPSLKPHSNFKKVVSQNWVRIVDEDLKKDFPRDLLLKDFKEKVGQYRYSKYKKDRKIEVYQCEKKATVQEDKIVESPFTLTEQQKKAVNTVLNTNKEVILLHGITGSGKTEVFLQLSKLIGQQDKQVLILVPEISLTPLMVKRFKERFNNIAVYNSALSAQEKYEQYCLVKENKVKIVVGTRSAVFMPFNNLGLIVIDEEHDNSYKQDSMPRYNTRDVAIERAKYHHCKVLLASATPTLESYARAAKNVYELVKLDKRINSSLPISHLIDMQNEIRKGNYIVSAPLKEAIGKRLQLNQQSILLLNRRGYTPIVKCSSCSHVATCPHCELALSYHKDENLLVCHFCGYSCPTDLTCPKCGQKMWQNYGVGTQRLEEEIHNIFPQAKIIRMDADTTRKKDAHSKILQAFENHEYDILIGTQMISKGLDFPNVTLVGIFNADSPLARNDYRSVETTFDLIVQASGRSGRSDQSGEVYVQSYDTIHYGIRLAVKQDYITFFNNEMSYRHALLYPPYAYLIAVYFLGKDDEQCKRAAQSAVDYFQAEKQIKILGPSELGRRKDEYRYRFVMKSKDKLKMIDSLWNWYNTLTINKNKINIQVDVDPYVLD
ncbi:MAG: primosomal protein N' [Erysipelotrichia bacterium]|nr:primosomal protein N' [Erysipelotrichia bacterium]